MPLLYSTMEQHYKVALHSTTSSKKSLISSSSIEANVASTEELLLQHLLISYHPLPLLNLFFTRLKILFGLEKALWSIAGLFDNGNPYKHVISPICPFFYLLNRIRAFLRVITKIARTKQRPHNYGLD